MFSVLNNNHLTLTEWLPFDPARMKKCDISSNLPLCVQDGPCSDPSSLRCLKHLAIKTGTAGTDGCGGGSSSEESGSRDEGSGGDDGSPANPQMNLVCCHFCNLVYHVGCAPRIPPKALRTGKVEGAWPCPECLKLAADALHFSDGGGAAGSEADPVDLAEYDESQELIYGAWSVHDLRRIASEQPDFVAQKSRITELIEERGHVCFMLPKFHCELSVIELYWCKLKHHTRNRYVPPKKSWPSLLRSMWEAFGQPDSLQHPDADQAYLPPDDGYEGELNDLFRQRAARKVREYIKLYYENADATPESIHALLRPLMKSKRQHRTPPIAGFERLG